MQDFLYDLSLILTIIGYLILIKKEIDAYIDHKIENYLQKNRPSYASKQDDGRSSDHKNESEH
jgi:hypothetical protein